MTNSRRAIAFTKHDSERKHVRNLKTINLLSL